MNKVIHELSHYYESVLHKRSTPYYPQENGLVESTNKTIQHILKKIVNKHQIDWDQKLHSALGIQNDIQNYDMINPIQNGVRFRGNNAHRVPDSELSVQVTERLDEEQSKQIRKEQLLNLEEDRLQAMWLLEKKQRRTKEFVD